MSIVHPKPTGLLRRPSRYSLMRPPALLEHLCGDAPERFVPRYRRDFWVLFRLPAVARKRRRPVWYSDYWPRWAPPAGYAERRRNAGDDEFAPIELGAVSEELYGAGAGLWSREIC